MSKVLHVQQTVTAPRARVFRSLTENADVSLSDDRYDFWGRFTPEAPVREDGDHVIEHAEPGAYLRFRWHLRGNDTTVDIRLVERGSEAVVDVRHHSIPPSGEPGMAGYAIALHRRFRSYGT